MYPLHFLMCQWQNLVLTSRFFKLIYTKGMSYNPSYEDHQDTLGAAVAQEIERQDKEKFLDYKLKIRRRMKTIKVCNNSPFYPLTLSKNFDKEDEEEEPQEKGKEEEKVKVHIANPDIKTKAQRNKEKRKREFGLALKKKRALKRMRKDIDRSVLFLYNGILKMSLD
jgi:hypothetical protein